jgi:hypothetical protein
MVLPIQGDRILVWKQTLASENGIYYAGTTRSTDFSSKSDVFEGASLRYQRK